jgi:hypothetical protein
VPEVSISETLDSMARHFNIDLAAVADAAIRDRIVQEPLSRFTSRMLNDLLAAQVVAGQYGHPHIGSEHLFWQSS